MWGGTTPCLEVVAAGVQKAMGLERIADLLNNVKQRKHFGFWLLIK